jgi:hypothetical protein
MKKQVFIHSKRRVVVVNGKQVPRLLLSIIQGSIGKKFVVKHYKGRKIVITRFPDMSGIVASAKQRERRDLFKEAVVYAKWIIADKERKKAFRKSLPRRKQRKVYQAAIQLYMSKQGDKQWLRKQLAVKGMMRAQVGDRPWTPGMQKEAMNHWQGTESVVVRVQEPVKAGVRVEGTVSYRQGAMSKGQLAISKGT